ncbi:MAG: HAMP domain-containing protein [Bacteroidetes bacterium]|nr:MAG: HAMP domain-containing protein [Bacteroidota bacterium]
MKKLTISKKIYLVFSAILLLIIAQGIFSITQLSRVNLASVSLRENWLPSIEQVSMLHGAVTNIRLQEYKHITCLDSPAMADVEDKMQLYFSEVRKIRANYKSLVTEGYEAQQYANFEESYVQYLKVSEQLIKVSQEGKKEEAKKLIYTRSLAKFNETNEYLLNLVAYNSKSARETSLECSDIYEDARQLIIVLLIVCALISFGVVMVLTQNIVNPVQKLTEALDKLAIGDVEVDLGIKTTDEIGKLAKSATSVVNHLKKSSEFAASIGEGKLDLDFSVQSAKDELGNSLLTMRDKLRKVAEEDKKQIWATEGAAKFGEILRNNSDLKVLCDQVISNLVKYLNANQGTIFLINEQDESRPFLEMAACYAFDRKKYTEMKINIGDGLVGQCFIEKDKIYLTNVPNDFINITSGLGNSNPKCILLVPLKSNDLIEGVIEIASFQELLPHEIAFIEKMAEAIASSVSDVKISEQTKMLLSRSQQQSEELRAQEEEVRQNMEELLATQEQMSQKEAETADLLDGYRQREDELRENERNIQHFLDELKQKNASIDLRQNVILELMGKTGVSFIEFDVHGIILYANEAFLSQMKYSLDEIKGKHHRMFVPKDKVDSAEYTNFWNDLRMGKEIIGTFERIDGNGEIIRLKGVYGFLKDQEGKIKSVIKFAQNADLLK